MGERLVFEQTFHVFHIYYITNEHEKLIKPKYRLVNNKYQWVINSRTLVEEAEEQYQAVVSIPLQFIAFKDPSKYIHYLAKVGKIIYIM